MFASALWPVRFPSAAFACLLTLAPHHLAVADTPPLVAFIGPLKSGIGLASLKKVMRELGYKEGSNIRYIEAPVEEDESALRLTISRMVEQKPRLIVAGGDNRTTRVAQSVTSSVPIIFGSVTDPVESGLVASLGRPGGNVTGVANSMSDILIKQIELAVEVFPSLADVTILASQDNVDLLRRVELTQRELPVKIRPIIARSIEDARDQITSLPKSYPNVLIVTNDPLFISHTEQISNMIAEVSGFAFCPLMHMARSGCLLTFGVNLAHNFERAAVFVDRILRGRAASELPVELPTSVLLTINLRVARARGVELPASVLVRADELIE